MSEEPLATPEVPQDGSQGQSSVDPQSVEGIFLSALAKAGDDRKKFLDDICGDDAERRRKVEALLLAYNDAGSFLEHPAVNLAGGAPVTVSLDFLEPSDDPSLLGMLGPYEIYELIGRGGMGVVFRARDPKLNRVVAIKVMAPVLAANPNARRRFIREAQAAAAVSHPHVVTIHAVDDDHKIPFLVMECIVGQTLQQKLDKQGSLRLTETLRISKQIAEGLTAAHKQGLIHRDIKPANILLENGVERVKISDFGLARAVDDVSVTRTGEVTGTPQFMSPEQAKGERVDHRSDLFSLGCVMYAMCTGRSPFRATSYAAAIRRVCDDTPRSIEEINQEVPDWLVDIVNRLLEKDPEDRFQSAGEVMDLLEDHLADVQAMVPRKAIRTVPSSTPDRASPTALHQAGGRHDWEPDFSDWIRGAGILLAFIAGSFFLFGISVLGKGYSETGLLLVISGFFTAGGLLAAFLSRSLFRNISPEGMLVLLTFLLGPLGIAIWMARKERSARSQEQSRQRLDSIDNRMQQERKSGVIAGHSGLAPWWSIFLAILVGAVAGLIVPLQDVDYSRFPRGLKPFPSTGLSWIIAFAFVSLALTLGIGVRREFDKYIYRRPSHWVTLQLGRSAVLLFGVFLAALSVFILRSYTDTAVARTLPPNDLDLWRFGAIAWLIGGILYYWMFDIRSHLQGPKETSSLPATGAYRDAGSAELTPAHVKYRRAQSVGTWLLLGGILLLVVPLILMTFQIFDFDGDGVAFLFPSSMLAIILGLLTKTVAWILSPNMPARTPGQGLAKMAMLLVTIFLGICVTSATYFYFSRSFSPASSGELQIVGNNIDKIDSVRIDSRIMTPVLRSSNNITFHGVPRGQQNLVIVFNDGQVERRTIDIKNGTVLTLNTSFDSGRGNAIAARPIPTANQPSTGGVIVSLTEPGLRARLEPIADAPSTDVQPDLAGSGEMDMMMGGSDYGGTSFWPSDLREGTQQVLAGKYQVVVYDDLFGWMHPGAQQDPFSGMPGMGFGFGSDMMPGMGSPPIAPSYRADTITIKPGEFITLSISRDLKKLCAYPPKWEAGKFYDLRWNGKLYTLSAAQAKVVQRLFEVAGTENPELVENNLLTVLTPADPRYLVSDEFFANVCGNEMEKFLNSTFFIVVGRSPNDEEWDIWQKRLSDPQWPRKKIVDVIFEKSNVEPDTTAQEEYLAGHLFEKMGGDSNKWLAEMYSQILHRPIRLDEAGRWIPKLDAYGSDRLGFVREFLQQISATPGATDWMPPPEFTGPPAESLAEVFNNGQHPAWGKLVVQGTVEDTYRLEAPIHYTKLDSDTRFLPSVGMPPSAAQPELPSDDPFQDWAIPNQQFADYLDQLRPLIRGLPVKLTSMQMRGDHLEIRGTAADEATRQKVEEAIRSLPGITSVTNQINVDSKPGAQDPDTAELAAAIRSQLTRLNAERTRLLQTMGKDHPKVREIEAQILSIRSDLGIPESTSSPGGGATGSPPVPSGSFVVSSAERQAGARHGTLTIDIQDPGITVAIRRRSTFDGTAFTSEEIVNSLGETNLPVTPGSYEVLIIDKVFGWGGVKQNLTVKEGETSPLVATHDLPAITTRTFKSTELLNPFYWNGREYHWFDRQKRPVVQKLVQARLDGSPDVAEVDLLPLANEGVEEQDRVTTLEELFSKNLTGEQILGQEIVKGEAEETWRITPIEQATLTLEVTSPIVTATLIYPESPAGGGRRSFGAGRAHVLHLAPGEYSIRTSTAPVGWAFTGADWSQWSQTPPGRTVSLQAGDEQEISIELDWRTLMLSDENLSRNVPRNFTWFQSGDEGSSWIGGTNLNIAQSKVISRLLQGLAEGQPDIPEEALLEAAGAEGIAELSDLFVEGENEMGSPWKGLIISGKEPGTWRLTPPPPAQIGPAEWQRLYGDK